MSKKIIIIGEIAKESYYGTPIEMFERAIILSKMDSFEICTNNPQFLEALEVLCGEKNIEVYLKISGEYKYVNVVTAYNYLGELYDTIDAIRILYALDDKSVEDDFLNEEMRKYNEKYSVNNKFLDGGNGK